MTRRRMARVLWAAAAAALCIGAQQSRRPSLDAEQEAALPTSVSMAIMPTSDSLLDAVGVVRELDLFRPERAALDSNASAFVPGMGAQTPPSFMRPPLVLRGVIGGTSLQALVEGLPGVEGTALLRTGETVAGITLRAFRRDTAILVGKDTTWKLTVRRF